MSVLGDSTVLLFSFAIIFEMLGGRSSDPIMSFFLKIEVTKMMCIDCNTYVSDKFKRLRAHSGQIQGNRLGFCILKSILM